MKKFDINEFKIKKEMPSENRASILYENVGTHKLVVIKDLLHKPFITNKDLKRDTEEDNRVILAEIEQIEPLHDISLANFITFIPPRSNHSYRIVTEYYPNGSLENLMNKIVKNNPPEGWSPTKMSIIIYGIALGLKFLHDKGIIHGNLKPSNILLDDQLQPKLVDYGFKRDDANSQYFPPEFFLHEEYTLASDIYSFGMILCYLYVQESPFDDSLPLEDLIDFVIDGERPILPGNIPPKISELIEKCWEKEPSERPTMAYIQRLLGDDEYLYPGTNVDEFQEYVKVATTVAGPVMKPVEEGKNPTTMYRFGMMLKKNAYIDKKKMIDAARYFKAAADGGVPDAAFEYAKLASKGIGIPQDVNDAAKYFKIAADQGNITDAMYEFAEMCCYGDGMEKVDERLAAEYYKKAGLAGNAEALHKASLLESKFIEEEQQKRQQLQQQQAQKTQKNSKFHYTPKSSTSSTSDQKVASTNDVMQGFKAAADGGIGQSAYQYGLHALRENKISDAIKYLKQAADGGIAEAAFELAKLFKRDGGKMAVAAKYFQIAADGGIKEAAYQFGLLMETCKTPLQKMEDSAKYFKIAADAGIAGALYQMYLIVHNGVGMQRSEQDANRYLELSSNQNFFPALYRSALVMQCYDNVPEYRKMSSDNFKKAADSNNLDAVYHYAIMKKTGATCVKKNLKQSAHYFKVAADLGNPYAGYQYALMLMTGNGVAADEAQTITYYKKAADSGFPDAMYQYALIMKQIPKQNATKQTTAEATKYFKMAIDNGVTDPLYQKALTFQTGKNARLKQNEAAECFKAAAEATGNPNAYYQFALIKQSMEAEPGSAKIASESFQKAADGGHIDAAYRFALMLKTGAAGTKKNLMESARYFKMAADGGNANAAYQYALMKHMGHGILRDNKEAAIYFKVAADINQNVDAMYQYAFMQPKNNEKEALTYFQMANSS